MKIAIQGETASFHEAAANLFFKRDSFTTLSKTTFNEVFLALKNKEADFGVVAAENSLYGSIHETYDRLITENLHIIGEVELQIEQYLISHPESALEDITEVYSHPAALDQCRFWLEAHLPKVKIIEHADTAGAVADIAKKNHKNQAAIASQNAADLYGMKVIANNIEDEANNITRFLVLSRKPLIKTQGAPNKATLQLITPHSPGSLYKALGVINDLRLNMTKIESRPVRGQPYKYQFIIDVMTNPEQLKTLLKILGLHGNSVTVLGHYKANNQSE